jgi:ABC-2 type transport system permease protein
MSLRRFLEVYRTDLRFQLKRPLLWVLVLIVAFLAWGLSTGHVHVASGDSDTGGKKAWVTSMFQQATFTGIFGFALYGFFVAVAAGMTVIRDEELKIGEILHGTPLTVGEYVWGKFVSVMTAFGVVLCFEVTFRALWNHVWSSAKAAEYIGPFALWNYVFPVIVFGLPVLLFMAGTSFLVGERSRKPILVFFLPIAALLVCLFFLWNWSPTWLDPRWNRLLMCIDPSGQRWLVETWTKVDRGVDFYNHQQITLDLPFAISRIGFALLGLVFVGWSTARLGRTARGRETASSRRTAAKIMGEGRMVGADGPARGAIASLASLGMRMSPPSFLAATLEVARIEFRELRSSPGLYLFGPLILLEAAAVALTASGYMDSQPLWTSGTLAVGMMNTLTFLVSLLLLFYTIESLVRERAVGLAQIHGSSSTPTASILFGKSLANAFVGIVILLFAFVAAAITLLAQGKTGISLRPFLVIWGLLLVPTFVVWSAFIAAVHSITRNRYTSYAIGLGVMYLTGWFLSRGKMTWVWNVGLWNAVSGQWSDLGTFELLRHSLLLNRLLWISAAGFFLAVAVRFFPRRDLDASGILASLRPKPLFRNGLRLGGFLIAPLVFGFWLQRDIDHGFEGETFKKLGKDYWAKNVETWKDAPKPSITDVVLDLELQPARSWFHARGTYTLTNLHEKALRQIALTPGPQFRHRSWTIDGEKVEPDDRAGLSVFTLDRPLEKDGRIALGFEHDGVFPDGSTKNGGGTMEFILPSGVVMTSFQPSFVPTLGFLDGIGVDEDNKTDPKVYPDDFYEGITESGFGNDIAHTTHITLHAPAEYTLNSSGIMVSDEVKDGVRTSIWESDRPVNFFNVVAGKWSVRRGKGTAIYYHPGHEYNLDEMSSCLDGALKHYSEWFRPYPWKELKLSEFPGLSSYAQGFATNITFSESIGFLTQSEPEERLAFMVTAHESAHQWWGNIIEPGKGPGGDVLSEGMAHFSTILLTEEMLGLRERISMCKKFEARYGDVRQVDSEKPLVKLMGSRDGDKTILYDKGGWVAWMLLNRMGRDATLAGLKEFIRRYEQNPDHPVLQDFIAVMREFAPDKASFDDFTNQWFFQVVVPEYEVTDGTKIRVVEGGRSVSTDPGEQWEVHVKVKNAGASCMPVEVTAARGVRFPDAKKSAKASSAGSGAAPGAQRDVVQAAEALPAAKPAKDETYHDSRTTITLGAGESQDVVLRCDFDPEIVLVDPDALVLQLERKLAVFRF